MKTCSRGSSDRFLTPRICRPATIAFLAVLLAVPLCQAAPPRLPNVVLILADDMGFSDLGCYGSEIETPHLDRLAANGLRFTQFYNTGRCWPTRAALLTGLYPHQARMAMNFGDSAPAAYSGLLPHTARMISELLASRGYHSDHVGKWHLNRGGEPNDTWPQGRGFASSMLLLNTDNYFRPGALWLGDHRQEEFPADFYVTDAFSEAAVERLKQHARDRAGQPFFLYLAHIAPHFPLHARADDVAHFRGRYRGGWDRLRETRLHRMKELGIVSCELSPRDPDSKPWDTLSDVEQDEWDARMATYAGMIRAIDRGVGKIVEQLAAMQSLDDTLILFMSDNGSSAEYIVRGGGHKPGSEPGSAESFRCLEVGWSNAANTPFRFHKMWMHEGGIASPLIVHWPARIREGGQLRQQVGHVIDILPTLLELAGVAYPAMHNEERTTPLPGRSLVPAFENHPVDREFLFWEHTGNKAIRRGDWKLVAEENRPWELYNLASDRSELRDLAASKTELVRELTVQWNQFAKQIGVVEWSTLPQSKAKPRPDYRRK